MKSPSRVGSNSSSQDKENDKKNNDTTVNVEMVEISGSPSEAEEPKIRKRRFKKKRGSNLWLKAANHTNTPLPVSLARQNSYNHVKSNFIDDDEYQACMGPKQKFNKNCKDQWGRSALFIAMLHQNLSMLQLLLQFKVS